MANPEYRPFDVFDHIISGNLELLSRTLNTKNAKIFVDGDGILIDSPTPVFEDFNTKSNLNLHPQNIYTWNYLTEMAALHGIGKDVVEDPEAGFYNPEVLKKSPRYLFSKPLVRMLSKSDNIGSENLHVLTARKSSLKQITREFFAECFEGLIPNKNVIFNHNKAAELKGRSKGQPCMLIDDHIDNIKKVLEEVPNCVCVWVPLGKGDNTFRHPNLITLGRYPVVAQGMLPTYETFKWCMSHNIDNSI